MDPESWDAGYQAGYAGHPQDPPPPGVKDRLAYCSGWIEGDATRTMTARAMAPVNCFECGNEMMETGRNEVFYWRRYECACGATLENRTGKPARH